MKEDGTVQDVAVGGPAQKAGIAPDDKLIAVNNRQFTATGSARRRPENRDRSRSPSNCWSRSGEYYSVHRVEYHGGEKYPHLERDESKPDLLTKISSPWLQSLNGYRVHSWLTQLQPHDVKPGVDEHHVARHAAAQIARQKHRRIGDFRRIGIPPERRMRRRPPLASSKNP